MNCFIFIISLFFIIRGLSARNLEEKGKVIFLPYTPHPKHAHILSYLVLSASLHPWYSDGKESASSVETQVQSLGWEEPLEEGMAATPVFLSGELNMNKGACLGSQRVRHD